ncbi:hypothetical protein CLV33_10915 [Jejuia pallidilutea]|uniref:STAS/SEC14 domain-containing protein n=1 Tax=Jejuia pallidilutea TaxID=504487 RepID=A0A362X9K7_9FLAO|nr:hypothetical protein [Jejuia pallidilutea]PQV46518.1 hypothetical protein CLV33_10915 [Jejuia pallidilutea]
MISVKQTELYPEVLKELNYSFGDVFIFNGFVISEIESGINLNWKNHGKLIVEDISCYLGTDGSDLVYISNRINSYAVMAVDWLKFFKNNYYLKAYYIVSSSPSSKLNLLVENLFFNSKIQSFNSLFEAVNWAKKGNLEIA